MLHQVRSRRFHSGFGPRKFLFVGVAASAIAIGAPAQAQSQGASATDSGDIVVTAQRREQNIDSVGISITAVSGETLANRVSSMRAASRRRPPA